MKINLTEAAEELRAQCKELFPLFGWEFSDCACALKVRAALSEEEGCLIVKKNGNEVCITAEKAAFGRALGILAERAGEEVFEVIERRKFRKFGMFLDQSRNGVMTVDALKGYIRRMAVLGYNRILLYLEDIYEVPEEPYFGALRGRYSRAEIAEVKAFCSLFGMDLVPCIQTLAHLNAPFKWWWYAGQMRDVDDILLIDSDMTYAFLENCIKSIAETFGEGVVNIGMDEAFRMGLGKYYDLHGAPDRFDLFCRHVEKVVALCEKYNLHPIMWSDMFYRIVFSSSQHYETDKELDEELVKRIPKDVGLIYWAYSDTEYDTYDKVLKGHRRIGNETIFAGGALECAGQVPFNKLSFAAIRPACRACLDNGVEDVFVTLWGDNGQEPSRYAVLPAVTLWAELAFGREGTEEELRRRMRVLNADYDDFMTLDLPAEVYDISAKQIPIFNSSYKYLLYNDPLLGMFDSLVVSGEYNRYYREYAAKIREAGKRNPDYGYVFRAMAALCSVLELKCDLGVRLKTCYDGGDRAGLERLRTEVVPELQRRLAAFYESVREQWEQENKIFGFEVQDIRIGALQKRLDTLTRRLGDYLEDRLDCLPELAEDRPPYTGRKETTDEERNVIMTYWNLMPTPGVL